MKSFTTAVNSPSKGQKLDQDKNKVIFRQFSRSAKLFVELGDSAAIMLASIGSDISLVISPSGEIEDVAFRNPDMVGYGCDGWTGKRWKDVVTVESVEKIDALLSDSKNSVMTRRRQMNHHAKGRMDLPVDYMLVRFPGAESLLALGNDLRPISAMQHQLVQFQVELENEYRKIRETEGRYRTIYHLSREPMIIVGDQDRRILDVNQAATNLLTKPAKKLLGESALNLFDKAERDSVGQKLQEVQHSGTAQMMTVRFAGVSIQRELAIEPYRENGRSNLLLHISEVSNEQSAENSIASEGLQLESIAEAAVITDISGVVTSINDRFLDITNILNRQQAVGRHLNNWLGGSSVDMQVLTARLRDEGRVRGFATMVRDEIGVSSPVSVSASRNRNADGREIFVFIISETSRRDTGLSSPTSQRIKGMSDFSELVGRVPLKELIREAVDVIEVMCIEAALRQTDNNRASAAELLGLSRQSVYLKLRRHGLEDFDTDS